MIKIKTILRRLFYNERSADMAISVLSVAKYVAQKCAPITTMKLQKLVYYCQAWSLAWDEQPLFEEDFEAWANGPVCPVLFKEHKGKFIIDKDFLGQSNVSTDFTPEQTETIDSVIETYGDKEPFWLSELTHKERPWKEARGETEPGEPCANVISKESMQEYYGGLIGLAK